MTPAGSNNRACQFIGHLLGTPYIKFERAYRGAIQKFRRLGGIVNRRCCHLERDIFIPEQCDLPSGLTADFNKRFSNTLQKSLSVVSNTQSWGVTGKSH